MSQTRTKLKGVNKDLWAMVITISITLLMTSLICLNPDVGLLSIRRADVRGI